MVKGKCCSHFFNFLAEKMSKMEAVTCICCQKDIDAINLRQILTEENENTDRNFARLEKALAYKRQLHDGNKLYLTVDSLITINNIVTNSNNFELRKHNVRPVGSKISYMDFYTILPALSGLIDSFNMGKIRPKTFSQTFLKIHPFADGNGRTCKVLFI